MADELLPYYEQELSFIRRMGAEYAARYPKIAGRLLLEANRCEDPHVERLLQAFALLAARIRFKLDDEFPELTDALLNTLYPHYLAPNPSFSIAQFVLDPEQGKLTGGHKIERGAMLHTQPVQGSPCRFRTCAPVTLWPIEVAAAGFDAPDRYRAPVRAAAVIRIRLNCAAGMKWRDLRLENLRFFIHGEGPLAYRLYELIFRNVRHVQLRSEDGRQWADLPLSALAAGGFGEGEAILPYTARSFEGYRLLQEYFAYPEKFLFFDLGGFGRTRDAGFGGALDVLLFLDRAPALEQPIGAENFRLGCVPVVNLFERIAEPIRVTQAETEYRVIADVRRQNATEVYSIDRVASAAAGKGEPVVFQPFFSFRHTAERESQPAFWYAARRPARAESDAGTELYLSLVDLDFRPAAAPADTLTLHVTCTNRDLAGKLPIGGDSKGRHDFELEGAAPLARIICLRKPTPAIRPRPGRAAYWRLLSHLSLNYLSICGDGPDALREILRLYDFSNSSAVSQQIEGITGVKSRRVVGRPASMGWNGFCRGIEVNIEFDEEKYVGSGVFLFASVLERFLGLYASLNSFSQLAATTRQREEPLKRWPPRAGNQILL
jgi:type VI secretion system protein ImpG